MIYLCARLNLGDKKLKGWPCFRSYIRWDVNIFKYRANFITSNIRNR